MLKGIDIIQFDEFSYKVSPQSPSLVSFDIHLKHNDQALTLIVLKKLPTKSITFKETFSFERLYQVTYPYLSLRSILDFKRELNKMIQSKAFDFKEENDRIAFWLCFNELNGEIAIREVCLSKFQEDYEKDVNVLMKRLNHLVRIQDSKISQIQSKDIDISNRITAIDNQLQLINNFIENYASAESKRERPQQASKRNSLPTNHLKSATTVSRGTAKPEPITQQRTLTASKTVRNLNAFNDHVPITNWISKTRFIKLESLYLGSKYDFSSSFFHCNFDNAVPTVVIVTLDNGAVFGGFTCQTWKGENKDKADQQAFLFSLNHNKKYQIRQSQVKTAIHCRQKFIVAFGNSSNFDLLIVDQGNKYECFSEFPFAYGNDEQKYSLTLGRKKFGIKEIEIFQVHYRD